MKLNLFTDYALRSLMYLSWHRNRTVTAEEIARFYGISRDHIVKVIQELSRHGYVQARRGRGGGSVLARDPRSITVCDVITTFEGTPALLDCLRNSNVCAIERTCKLKQTLSEAQARMFDYLDTVSVEDIAGEFEPETISLTPSVALNAISGPATNGVALPNGPSALPNGPSGLSGPPTPNAARTS